jgi:hypothetical protein
MPPKVEGEAAKVEGEEPPKGEGDAPKGEGDAPKGEGDAAKTPPKGDDCKKNVKGDPDCAVPPKPNAGQQQIDNLKAGINDKVSSFGSSLKNMFVNPEKCVNNYVESAPNLISAMIDGIGKSISGSFNSIADSIGHLSDETVDMNLVNPVTYAKNKFTKKFQDVFNQMVLGDGWEAKLNTDQDPAVLAKIIEERSVLMKSAFDNIKFRNGFTKWINNYLDSLTASLEIARPKIDALKKEMNDTVEGIGDGIGTTIGHSVTNAIVTALSVIPGVGTVVAGINSATKMSEELIKTCGEPIAKIGGITKRISNTVKEQTDILDCQVKKVTKLFDSVPKTGGSARQNNIKKIYNTTKRVNYLLNRFAGRQKKINYTRRLRRF